MIVIRLWLDGIHHQPYWMCRIQAFILIQDFDLVKESHRRPERVSVIRWGMLLYIWSMVSFPFCDPYFLLSWYFRRSTGYKVTSSFMACTAQFSSENTAVSNPTWQIPHVKMAIFQWTNHRTPDVQRFLLPDVLSFCLPYGNDLVSRP